MPSTSLHHQEILSYAARLVVEDGFEYGPAKHQALKQLGLTPRTALPDNNALEDAIKEYIDIFYAETQPLELKKMREIALHWMREMKDFSPHLSGAVWHGTATRNSDIHLQLFCDDPKAAEIHLLNKNIKYTATEVSGLNKQPTYTLCVTKVVPEWSQQVLILMSIYDAVAIRGALKADAKDRPPRGSLQTAIAQFENDLNQSGLE